jgi:hypothetical protein
LFVEKSSEREFCEAVPVLSVAWCVDAGHAGAGGLGPDAGPDGPTRAAAAGHYLLDTLGGPAPGNDSRDRLMRLRENNRIIVVRLSRWRKKSENELQITSNFSFISSIFC